MLLHKTAALIWFLMLVSLPAMTLAGLGTDSGEEPGYWNTHSMIFAEVVGVERITHGDYKHGTHHLQVRPKATLTGSFDSSRLPTLELSAWFGGFDCNHLTPPTKGRYIVAVIRKDVGEYFLASSILKFMPDGNDFVEVKDFSDPLVAEIFHKVQAIRRISPWAELRFRVDREVSMPFRLEGGKSDQTWAMP
jgi:hypothetical protein